MDPFQRVHRHRALFTAGMILLALPVWLARPLWADGIQVPPQCHPWARFAPGAWVDLRLVAESLDGAGRVNGKSVTQTRTTLLGVEKDAYQLRIQSTLTIAGKNIVGPAKVVRRTFDDVPAMHAVTVTPVGRGAVTIEKKRFDCRIYESVVTGTAQNTTVRTHYCSKAAPYVLSRQVKVTGGDGRLANETEMQVIALEMPHKVIDQLKTASHVKQVLSHATGVKTTLAVLTLDVPGGLVTHTSKEVDTKGNIVRRSALELVGYGVQRVGWRRVDTRLSTLNFPDGNWGEWRPVHAPAYNNFNSFNSLAYSSFGGFGVYAEPAHSANPAQSASSYPSPIGYGQPPFNPAQLWGNPQGWWRQNCGQCGPQQSYASFYHQQPSCRRCIPRARFTRFAVRRRW